jgi:hypothetical protein
MQMNSLQWVVAVLAHLLPPPKQRPQSHSPPCPGDDIKWINPFDDRFLTSFPPLGGRAPALPGKMGNLSDPVQQKRLEELMVLALLELSQMGITNQTHYLKFPLNRVF